jgi:hypothetical protein
MLRVLRVLKELNGFERFRGRAYRSIGMGVKQRMSITSAKTAVR